jgi:hypothetical protein
VSKPFDAVRFAKEYVRVTEALIREGVEEDVARYEARMTAVLVVYVDLVDIKCNVCGTTIQL